MRYPPEIEAFRHALTFLLCPNSPRGRALFSAIRRTLIQYNLDGFYEPDDILSEACERALKYFRKHGQSINNPWAWLRTTSINIIKEKSRSGKHLPITGIDMEKPGLKSQVSDQVIDDNIDTVCRALESLSAEDQLILNLRYFEGESWETVGYYLEQEGYGSFKVPTLRKRGQRATERLRIAFHKIRPS